MLLLNPRTPNRYRRRRPHRALGGIGLRPRPLQGRPVADRPQPGLDLVDIPVVVILRGVIVGVGGLLHDIPQSFQQHGHRLLSRMATNLILRAILRKNVDFPAQKYYYINNIAFYVK